MPSQCTQTSVVSVRPFRQKKTFTCSNGTTLINYTPTLGAPYGIFRKISIMFFVTLVLVSLSFPVCFGDDHLTENKAYIALVSVPFLGHINPLKALAEELIFRGYRVSLALPDMYKNIVEDIPGLELIPLGSIVDASMSEADEKVCNIDIYHCVVDTLKNFAKFQRPMFENLLNRYKGNRPDIVVIDRFTFAGFDVCHSLNLPYVVNNPFLLTDIDEPPAYVPAPYSGFPMESQTVWQRCANGYFRLQFRLANIIAFRDVNSARANASLPPLSSRWDLFGKHLVLTNTAFGVEYARPMPPLFQMVGPLISRNLPTIPPSTEKWLSDTSVNATGTLFVNLGRSINISSAIMKLVAKALVAERFRLLWVAPKSQWNLFDDIPASIRLVESAEQLAILHHQKISFVVTSCDFHSVQEALYFGKPILGLPFSVDQMEVAARVTNIGAGVSLDVTKLVESEIRHFSRRLMNDNSFAVKATRLGGILKSSGGVERAADLVISALELGTEKMVPERSLLPWYKVYLVDVYAVYGGVLCGVTVILRTLWSACWSLCENMTKKTTKVE